MPPSALPASAYDALELPKETVKILTDPKPSASPASIASQNLLQDAQQPEQRLAMNESSITLYAELLLHARTVSFYASLRTVHTRETKAKLASDGRSITVSHEGESATIRLPMQVEGGGDAALSLPASPPSKSLTLRLQIEEKEGSDMLGTLRSEERKANLVPWDGASLDQMKAVTIHCKSCQGVIIPKDVIQEWRDLPNENWAEMMDFWHCHKPDEHHLHDHTNEDAIKRKGYAAGNRLEAAEGVGFVDLASFLLKEQDCNTDNPSSGWLIYKYCISLSAYPSKPPTTYPIQKWISARLVYLIENQNFRRFHVHPNTSSVSSPVPSLLLWILTPDLFYSSSIDQRYPTRAMKVFYQRQTWVPLKPGEPESALVEDVEFPGDLFEELGRALDTSQDVLPASARKFQGWEVGIVGEV
ncbi:hypothetical protein N0V90_011975 [Kalmusia sp. IMI 367209]|nr:hypothetical protein N0V90_011975 [Kalmusia sp. IMI 367209]